MMENRSSGSGMGLWALLFVIVALIAAGTWGAYTYGEGVFTIDGRTISELEPWEVIGGVIIGILGLLVGLVAGAIGLVVGLIAAVASIALGLAGVAVGLFITAGTLLGPFLLIAAIILLMRRRQSGAASASVNFADLG